MRDVVELAGLVQTRLAREVPWMFALARSAARVHVGRRLPVRPRAIMVEPSPRRPDTSETPSAGAGHAAIAQRAYELFLARGAIHGHDLDDWLTAERELKAQPGAGNTAS
jgi:hypothetical protein